MMCRVVLLLSVSISSYLVTGENQAGVVQSVMIVVQEL